MPSLNTTLIAVRLTASDVERLDEYVQKNPGTTRASIGLQALLAGLRLFDLAGVANEITLDIWQKAQERKRAGG